MDSEKDTQRHESETGSSPDRNHEKLRQSRDETRASRDFSDIDRRIGAIVKSQKSGHANRRGSHSSHGRKSLDGRKSHERRMSDKSSGSETIPEVPAIPPVAHTEPEGLPDFRFSLVSDRSSDPNRDAITLADHLDPHRRSISRAGSARTEKTGRSLAELTRHETKLAQKIAHPWQHLGLTLGGPMIILFDLVIPTIIYYAWYNNHRSSWWSQCQFEYPGLSQGECPIPFKDYDKDILGYAIICFGFGELWILIARIHRLLFQTEECAPLLSRHKWELDATSWVYGVAMILALIPFVVGSSLELTHLYLYSPSFIMGFLGILMVITTFIPFNFPFHINSQSPGTELRPFIYYAAEDFIAVDGLQDREFRVRFNERYETNRMFRKFFVNLTLWWMLGVCIYIGSVSAVIWTLPFHYAFGVAFGILFAYIACWAGVTVFWVKYEMAREHRAYEQGEIEA